MEAQTFILNIINIKFLSLNQSRIDHQIISWINIIYQNSWHQTVVLKLIHNPGLNDHKSNRNIKSLIVFKKTKSLTAVYHFKYSITIKLIDSKKMKKCYTLKLRRAKFTTHHQLQINCDVNESNRHRRLIGGGGTTEMMARWRLTGC